jgi:predicted double-glycine peptidase
MKKKMSCCNNRTSFLAAGALIAVLTSPSLSSSLRLLDVQDLNTTNQSRKLSLAHKQAVIRQTSPATCGPAALATLLTFYFDDPITEEEVTKLAGTDKKTMASLRELRDVSRARGYTADGFRWGLPRLLHEVETTGVPVLVHFKEPTQHFVLVVGEADEFILVSDPSRGEVSIHQTDFLRRWDNFALVVKTTRPVNSTLVERRKRSAEARIQALKRASSLMSTTRF